MSDQSAECCCRKDRILDAAENAFAEVGFDAASLRQIVQEADVNLATVYYYFGSKEGLLQAVFTRRFGPLKQEQLDRLRQAQEAAGAKALSLEKVLETMLSTALSLTASDSEQKQIARRLIGRMVNDPNPKLQEMLHNQHNKVREAYFEALHRALPNLPTDDLRWRLEFIWGALGFILCNPGAPKLRCLMRTNDISAVLPQMMAFFSAGLRAPAASDFVK